jgi:beta-lactamase class A
MPSMYQSHESPRYRRKRRWAALLGVTGLVIGALLFRLILPTDHAKAHSAAPIPKPAVINQAQLAAAVNQAINATNLEVGVSITDLTNGQQYDYGLGDTEYLAASTTKLLSAALFLHQVEQGQASLNQLLGTSTARAEMQRMIVISDDTAWEDFNSLLGHPALLQYARGIGLDSYDPDNNLISSDDLALLLAQLYQGKLLNQQHTNLLLAYMSQADYTQYIGSVIPTGVKFYHKIGFLDDRVMDAAIIDNGHHPYVLVIFTKDDADAGYDQTAGLQVFHTITQATLTAFAH